MDVICALNAGIFEFFSDRKAQSLIIDASVVRQHSLLARGGRCTNATHIFVRGVLDKGSWVCLKYCI